MATRRDGAWYAAFGDDQGKLTAFYTYTASAFLESELAKRGALRGGLT
jgi:hypothetical protein